MTQSSLVRLLTTSGLFLSMAVAVPAAAQAEAAEHAQSITVPAMPLADALREIQQQSGEAIAYDPDAVRELRSQPVDNATSVEAAVRQAARGLHISVGRSAEGVLQVGGEIVVIAHRDEAETSILVNQTSTSSRLGQSLREQPRNTQVLSAKLIADQQALDMGDILRNAGGVSLTTSPQSGAGYTVRGFSSGGLVNGLSGASTYGVPAGSDQPVANIERVEILKGPDALLVGVDNLGGNVNVVTKRPSADRLLQVTFDTGSYGLARGTVDANTALNDSGTLSGRIVASAQTMSRNYGGYKGDEAYLIAPSLRFKNANTDIVVGLSANDNISGMLPFTMYIPTLGELISRPTDKPFLTKDQSIRIANTRYYFDASQKVTDWLTLVARGQHEKTKLEFNNYPFSGFYTKVLPAPAVARYALRGSAQEGSSNAADAFARIRFETGGVKVSANVGYNYSDGDSGPRNSKTYVTFNVPLEESDYPVQPRPVATEESYILSGKQHGAYGQAMIEFGGLHLLGGVRHSWYASTFAYPAFSFSSTDRVQATTPNFGAVYDISDNVSIFANYVEGFSAITSRGFDGNKLPNINSVNIEGGVKLELLNEHMVINASYFRLKQDNILVGDPDHPGYLTGGPGQIGKGIDLNVAGVIMSGWTVQASFTRTKYDFLSPNQYQTVVPREPRDTYSLYTSYRAKIATDLSAGLAGGFYGRSSSSADYVGTYYVPEAHQFDLNGFLSFKGYDLNVGIRNVFNRRNYNVTSGLSYIPIDEPRNVRITISHRFF